MANNFTLTLDTTGPASPSIVLEGGAQYATQQLITATIGTADGNTSGYQMKIWGSVDTAYDAAVQSTEGASQWITYATSKQVKLSAGDGAKTLYVRIRDDVLNESGQANDSITLDTTRPVPNITGPDVSKVSKMAAKDTCSFSFASDQDFVEYKVKVVASGGAAHDTGVQIPTTNGSTNMSGVGAWTTASVIECTIKGADLEAASAGDGAKIIKVFVKDPAGNWSA